MMKKCLAGLLMAIMCFAGAEAWAECMHANTKTGKKWENQFIELEDKLYHEWICDVWKYVWCLNCQTEIGRTHLETTTSKQKHSWTESDVCKECRKVNDCTHDGEIESDTENLNYRYLSTGDLRYHQLVSDAYKTSSCVDCGKQLSSVSAGTEGWDQLHSWNDENVCQQCGQENACEHEAFMEYTETAENNYTKIDQNTHLHEFVLKIQRNCTMCDLNLEERKTGKYEAVQLHRWNDNGVCSRCDAENTCKHESTHEREYTNEITYTDAEDGLLHRVWKKVCVYTYCDECDAQVGDCRLETREYTEQHTNQYHCWDCNYQAECLHENGSYESEGWLDERVVALDETLHAVYGRKEIYCYCRDCDEEIDVKQSTTEELLLVDAHHWEENVCDYCNYEDPTPCEHKNTDVKLQSTYSSGWIAQNETIHAQTVIYKELSCCTDCGKTLGEISALKKVTKTERHTFGEGKCWDCGYWNPCAHDGETYTNIEKWEWWEFVCVDDKTHKIDAVPLAMTYCDLCKELISEEKQPRQWIVEEHNMWTDSCDYCGYRKECEHKNTVKKVLPSPEYLFCESISDNAHSATHWLNQYDYCEDCETRLESADESDEVGVIKVNQPHNIVNHRCVECGYCEHPEEMIEIDTDSIGQEYVKYDEYLHRDVRMFECSSKCMQCGTVLRSWTETDSAKGLILDAHNYNDQGICKYCNYVNVCKHDNAYRVPIGYWSMQYENIEDDKQHQVKQWLSSEMYCPDCQNAWDIKTEEEPVVSMEDHDYRMIDVENGIWGNACSDCDYITDTPPAPCTHENSGIWRYWDDDEYEYVDENYHNRYGINLYEEPGCFDCGYSMNEVQVQEGRFLLAKNEPHVFNEKGRCLCGFVNTCKHQNTISGAYHVNREYILQVDDTHHKRVGVVQNYVFCADCAYTLSKVEKLEEVYSYEKHSFNEFDVCSDCKYVNDCKHQETQAVSSIFMTHDEGYSPEAHWMHRSLVSREVCLACGMTVGEETSEYEEFWQPHDGEDCCSICGWWVPGTDCDHVWEEKEFEERIVNSANAIDELTHEAIIQKSMAMHCAQCDGYKGENILKPKEVVVEPHTFTDLGRCEDCGYVNFCKHEETYEKPIYYSVSDYKMKDENEHTYIADVQTQIHCKICDQRLSYTAALNVECTEEHVFDSVADLICDLCGYEKELPEEVATPEPTPTATPEPTPEPTPTKKPSSGGAGGSGTGASGGTVPSKPKDTATPTPEEAMPRTGDTSLPIGFLVLVVVTSLCGIALLKKKKLN